MRIGLCSCGPAIVPLLMLALLPAACGDDDDDGAADTDADSDTDTDSDTDACAEIGPVVGDCDEQAEKTPTDVATATGALVIDWSCYDPNEALEELCNTQPGLQCHLGDGAILIVRSQAAAESLDGVCGPFPVPTEVDWEAQTLLVASLSMGTCGYVLDTDWRFYSLTEGGLEADLFIWNPENPFESDTCDSGTNGSLTILADTADVEAACLYDRPPCD